MVLFEITGATGLVCRCRIPTVAVAQRGLTMFRILLGSGDAVVRDVGNKEQGGSVTTVSNVVGTGAGEADIKYYISILALHI